MAESPAELRAKVLKLAEKTPPAPPEGVWVGTWEELEALDLPESTVLANVGDVPLHSAESLLIYGPSNVGKSLLGMRLALAVAASGKPVLIVQGEGSKRNFRERLRRLATGLAHDAMALAMPHVHLTHGNFGLVEHIALWKAMVEKAKPALVMIDPMVSYFRGDENAADEMAVFLSHVDIAKAAGATVVVVHHSTKPDSEGKSRERGSGALRAWCDEAIGVTKGKADEVLLTHDKSREHGMKGVQRINWTFTDALIACDFAEAPPDAAKKAKEHKRERDLLGELDLAGGEMPLADVRKKLGSLSGTALQELVSGLEEKGLVHRVTSESEDSLGRGRDVVLLRKGAR
jgi:hypothetical protein